MMAEGSSSSSGEDPFLEVKAISRVLSSEATRRPEWDEVRFGSCMHMAPMVSFLHTWFMALI